MSTLTIRNLWKSYGSTPILERINLNLADGDFCAIVGPSGAGKSTLLRLLLGQETPTRGSVRIGDRPLPTEPSADCGIVFQRYSVFPHLNVIGNLLLAQEMACAPLTGRLWGGRRQRSLEQARELLARVGLDDAASRYPSELSGGMQQRLALAQALAREPRLLLLDEPFGALDPGTRTQMQELLRELWRVRRMTVFMVTHDLSEAFSLATRLVVLDRPRTDPHDASAYGATITNDIPLTRPARSPAAPRLPTTGAMVAAGGGVMPIRSGVFQ